MDRKLKSKVVRTDYKKHSKWKSHRPIRYILNILAIIFIICTAYSNRDRGLLEFVLKTSLVIFFMLDLALIYRTILRIKCECITTHRK